MMTCFFPSIQIHFICRSLSIVHILGMQACQPHSTHMHCWCCNYLSALHVSAWAWTFRACLCCKCIVLFHLLVWCWHCMNIRKYNILKLYTTAIHNVLAHLSMKYSWLAFVFGLRPSFSIFNFYLVNTLAATFWNNVFQTWQKCLSFKYLDQVWIWVS